MSKQHYHLMSIAIPTPGEVGKFKHPIYKRLFKFIGKYKLFAGEVEIRAKDRQELENIIEIMYDNLFDKGEEYITNVQQ